LIAAGSEFRPAANAFLPIYLEPLWQKKNSLEHWTVSEVLPNAAFRAEAGKRPRDRRPYGRASTRQNRIRVSAGDKVLVENDARKTSTKGRITFRVR